MQAIPHIIHQIWSGITEPLPAVEQQLGETWKKHHPTWQYEFWDNERMNGFIQEHYPQYWDKYNRYLYNVQRWDAIRYLILETLGGLYVDFDYECLHPQDELLAGKTCCFAQEPQSHCRSFNRKVMFNNAWMASVTGHPFMHRIVEEIFSDKVVNYRHASKEICVWSTTGPWRLIDLYESSSESQRAEISLISDSLVTPLDYTQAQRYYSGERSEELLSRLNNAVAVHYFFSNWTTYDERGVQSSKKRKNKKATHNSILSQTEKDALLLRIARYLMLHSSFTLNLGLLQGKMGIILFFYEYARYCGNKLYEDFADKLLDEIFKDIAQDAPINFKDGLCGIAWGIEYLIQNGFVEGDADEVLQELDQRITEWNVRRITDTSLETGLAGIACYVAERRKGKTEPHPILISDYLADLRQAMQRNGITPAAIQNPLERILDSIQVNTDTLFGGSDKPVPLGIINNGCAGIGLALLKNIIHEQQD